MAKKNVRVYYTTFVEVEMESEDFASEEEMKEHVRLNASDFIDELQLVENLAFEPIEIDICDIY